MVITGSLDEIMVNQILWYYKIELNSNERAFINLEIKSF